MLFAQQKFGGGGGGGGAGAGGPPAEFWIIFAVVMVVIIAISLAIQIFYLLTLSRCFHRISPHNRKMEPGQVWLNLIPCFGTVWIFITVIRLSESLEDEFYERRLRKDGDMGKNLGIMYNVMVLLGAIPYIGGIFSLVGLVMWIMYWVKIAGFSRQLAEDSEDRMNSDDPRDFDDDRPSRRRPAADDDDDDIPLRRRDDDDPDQYRR
jgi:hypothetical protein